MEAKGIVAGAIYTRGKVQFRVLEIVDTVKKAMLVEVARNKNGSITGHGKVLANPVAVTYVKDARGRVEETVISVDGGEARGLKANEGLRFYHVGGVVRYYDMAKTPADAKTMPIEEFAKKVEARAN
jgi:hypothetical protein